MKISVIIPVYNTEERLKRCLDSVVAQTFKDFECIVVDDGSKDLSPQIIDEFAAKDSRFTAIHKPNGGVSSARNEGLKVAEGEWVVFLDSDDTIKPNHIEAMLSVVEDGIDIVFINGYLYINRGIVQFDRGGVNPGDVGLCCGSGFSHVFLREADRQTHQQ